MGVSELVSADLLVFDPISILQYTNGVAKAPSKPKTTTQPPIDENERFTVIQRNLTCSMQSPVPLENSVLTQFIGNGVEANDGVFTLTMGQFEIKAGTSGSPLITFNKKPKGVLLSMNILEETVRSAVIKELRFITSTIKKCRANFELAELVWEIQLDTATNGVTSNLRYKVDMLVQFFRYFSSDVSSALHHVLVPHLQDHDVQTSTFTEEYRALPINTHLFYRTVTDRTRQLQTAKHSYNHPQLDAQLMAFQSRSVEWMLERELMRFDSEKGQCVPVPLVDDDFLRQLESADKDRDTLDVRIHSTLSRLCFGWKRSLFKGQVCWYNRYTGNIMSETQIIAFLKSFHHEATTTLSPGCGLLSEEMGLGKTVEVTSLVLHNPRPASEINTDISLRFKEGGDFHTLRRARTTIIAAPETILQQWFAEICNLSPSLRVTIYRGMGKYDELNNIPKYVSEFLQRFDIVLINYSTMSRETDYAQYSTRHKATRGSKRHSQDEKDEDASSNKGTESEANERNGINNGFKAEFSEENGNGIVSEPADPNAFKADFLADRPDPYLVQKKYEKSVIEELKEKIRQTPPESIPHTSLYESPIMLCQWWRVVLDEVQMVSYGTTRAFLTASLIPRHHSWGVSGTPSTSNAVLKFLRVSPFDYTIANNCYKHLTNETNGNADFINLWLPLAIRHTKAMVHREIQLPPQKRVLLSAPFTEVEQDRYKEVFESTLAYIGIYDLSAELDKKSIMANISHLRQSLVKLRQICCSIQMGRFLSGNWKRGRNKAKIFASRMSELKTLENVLEDMLHNSVTDIQEAEKSVINGSLDLCQTLEYVLYPELVIECMDLLVEKVATLIARVKENCDDLHREHAELQSDLVSRGVVFGKDAEVSSDEEESEDEQNQYEGEQMVKTEETQVVKKETGSREVNDEKLQRLKSLKEKLSAERIRLRSWKMVQHKCYFLLGSAHFQLYDAEYQEKISNFRVEFPRSKQILRKIQSCLESTESVLGLKIKSDSELPTVPPYVPNPELPEEEQEMERNKHLESAYYELAEGCRKDILKHPIKDVETITAKKISNKEIISDQDWVNDGSEAFHKSSSMLLSAIPKIEVGDLGVLIYDPALHELVDNYIGLVNQLNAQAQVINEHVTHLLTDITNKVLSADKNPDGEEYEQSIQDQDKCSCLILIITQMLTDRSMVVTDPKMHLTDFRDREERDMKAESQMINDQKFLKALQKQRLKVKPQFDYSLEELVSDFRFPQHSTNFSSSAMSEIAARAHLTLQNELACQNFMKKELKNTFNAVFNARVEYFKQLQSISDSVQHRSTVRAPLDSLTSEMIDSWVNDHFLYLDLSRTRLIRSIARWKYLTSLLPKSEQKSEDEDSSICIICRSEIIVGSLTSCGHKFCKTCLDEWLINHSSCPVCKSFADRETVYGFTSYRANLKADAVEVDNVSPSEGNNELHQIYKSLDGDTLKKIQRIKLKNSFGSKADMIVRQVLYLKSVDPDVQIVIFSHWPFLLAVLATSFDECKVSYVFSKGSQFTPSRPKRFDPVQEFKKSGKTCFLMSSQAQSSGLTLNNATHIFLCEPLLNTATELQAISRIHRIGQKKSTTVWMFAIQNTVEENLVSLGTRKRIEYLKSNAEEMERDEPQVESFALQEQELLEAESIVLTSNSVANKTFVDSSDMAADSEIYSIYFGLDS